MASFYKRGGYQWEARIRRRGYPTIGRTFESKSEAQIWAIQTEAEMQRGSFIVRNPAEDLSMRDLIERFTNEVSPSCWRRSNIDHLCRLNFDQGLEPAFMSTGCG